MIAKSTGPVNGDTRATMIATIVTIVIRLENRDECFIRLTGYIGREVEVNANTSTLPSTHHLSTVQKNPAA